MQESQAVLNGKSYLKNRRTVILGISPGNPHYYKLDVLEQVFDFAKKNSEKMLLFIPDKISEHNYQAVGSQNPQKSARVKANRLRNKCNEAIQRSGIMDTSYSFIKWMDEVEECPTYTEAFQSIKNLYEANNEFRVEIRETTETALICLIKGRGKGSCNKVCDSDDGSLDLEEGVQYLLKELAFFVAVPMIYESCDEFVLVYHRSWPVLEKYFGGCYDGVPKPSLGLVVFE